MSSWPAVVYGSTTGCVRVCVCARVCVRECVCLCVCVDKLNHFYLNSGCYFTIQARYWYFDCGWAKKKKGLSTFPPVWTRQLVLVEFVLAENFYEIFNFVINYVLYAQLKLKLTPVEGNIVEFCCGWKSELLNLVAEGFFERAGRLGKLNSLMWFKKETLSIRCSTFLPCNLSHESGFCHM